MRALRIRFLLVATAVLVPVGLLVWRALASVAVEQRRRHEVVAERVFDEMERTLSELLAAEEVRPVAGFGGASPQGTPWLLGWFDVAPDGRVVATPAIVGLTGLTDQAAAAQARDVQQRAGSTVDVAAPHADAKLQEKRKDAGASAYDALTSLNKAAAEREARQKTLADAYRSQEYAERDAGPPLRATRRADDDAATAGAKNETGTVFSRALDPDVAPFTGRLADPRHLVLSRTVIHTDGRAGRQGVVLDVGALGEMLRASALASAAFQRGTTVAFGTAGAPPPADDARYAYQHRFAEPFDALTARLTLAPLPGFGGAMWVLALASLLLAAVVTGLVALYRMVAVAVRFAERRSNFVAAVTHELKTPLTAIRMYAEMLRDGIVPTETKRDEYHRHITAESERLSRLIDNVLEFSRLERNARPMTLVVGAIGPVLEEAVTMLRPHVEQAGLALRVDVEPDLPAVRFERDALLQIVFNLVDNAVKYAGGAPGEVVVQAARADDGRVAVRVRDRGPGVPREHLARVFEPFHRGERELVRRTKGTGLGLALVRSLTEAMGGRVHGRNVPDGGFEVEVALRAAAA